MTSDSRKDSAAAGTQGGVVVAVLMPHAPVLIPGVGGERAGAVAKTVRALRQAAREIVDARPDAVVLISPHSPRRHGFVGIWGGPTVAGSLASFGIPEVSVRMLNHPELSHSIAREAETHGLQVRWITDPELDHGAVVPGWFLAEAGWQGPLVVLGLGYGDIVEAVRLGEAVSAAARATGLRLGTVASGDMSHRLTPGAPCGFHPRARLFDLDLVRKVGAGDYLGLRGMDPELRELAAEDALESTLVAGAASDWQNSGHRWLSYEGPFGVGYGVAVLLRQPA